MAKIDKDRCDRILRILEDAYPAKVNLSQALGELAEEWEGEIRYLADHGLIDVKIYGSTELVLSPARITTLGLDRLDETGGYTAELGTLTVKIHEDSLRQILELAVLRSDLDQPRKKQFVDQLRELPAETTKHLALKVVDVALEQSGKLIPLLQSILGG